MTHCQFSGKSQFHTCALHFNTLHSGLRLSAGHWPRFLPSGLWEEPAGELQVAQWHSPGEGLRDSGITDDLHECSPVMLSWSSPQYYRGRNRLTGQAASPALQLKGQSRARLEEAKFWLLPALEEEEAQAAGDL